MLIVGDAGNNYLVGTEDADQIYGLGGNDVIEGRGGQDYMDGGTGIDTISYAYPTLSPSGGWRIDLAQSEARSLGGPTVERILNFENVWGSAGGDQIYGTSGANRLEGRNGDDLIYGGAGADTLFGGGQRDTLYGGAQIDRLYGGTDNDRLFGGTGNDVLEGGAGADQLHGGANSDTFVFRRTGDSPTLAGADIIEGFDGAGRAPVAGSGSDAQDRIDLSPIDAIAGTLGINEAFTFLGVRSNTFTTFQAGTVWLSNSGAETVLRANVDTDLAPELVIRIRDGATRAEDYYVGILAGSDIIL